MGSEEVAVEGMKAGLSNYVLKKHLDHLPFAIRESLEKAKLRKQYDAIAAEARKRASLGQKDTGSPPVNCENIPHGNA